MTETKLSELRESSNSTVIGKPDGGSINVEIDSLVTRAESSRDQPHPDENIYAFVEILPSGWVRCVRDIDRHEREGDEYEGEAVDYYPPERINGIFTLENEPRIE